MKLIAAIARSIRDLLSSTATGALKALDGLMKIPGQVFGFGSPRMPSTPPEFEPAVDPRELLAELSNGHAAASTAASAVDPVSLVVRYAKTPQAERMQLDLSKLDVASRAKLWSMKESDLVDLARSPRANIEKFLKPSVKSARPDTKTADPVLATPAELQKRIRALMGSGSIPYRNPLTP
jgi:hypothetical protein